MKRLFHHSQAMRGVVYMTDKWCDTSRPTSASIRGATDNDSFARAAYDQKAGEKSRRQRFYPIGGVGDGDDGGDGGCGGGRSGGSSGGNGNKAVPAVMAAVTDRHHLLPSSNGLCHCGLRRGSLEERGDHGALGAGLLEAAP